jgi:hypothetical protein
VCCPGQLPLIFVIDNPFEIWAVISSTSPIREGIHLKNQICDTGTASQCAPSFRAEPHKVTSTPQRSQNTTMFNLLVLSARTLPSLRDQNPSQIDRLFWFKSTVIYSLWIFTSPLTKTNCLGDAIAIAINNSVDFIQTK